MQKYGIHWFRRDLRVAGNTALKKNWEQNQGRVVGIFCFDKKFLSRSDFSVPRFSFFMNTLSELRDELRQIGSDLILMDVGPEQAWGELLNNLQHPPSLVTWNRDYEPYARKRDSEMEQFFASSEIETQTYRDHLLIEPSELSKPTSPNETYQVYSPFARRWLDIFQDNEIQERLREQASGLKYLENRHQGGKLEKIFSLTWSELLTSDLIQENLLKEYQKQNDRELKIKIPQAGSLEAYRRLRDFREKVEQYGESRDFPQRQATSQLSHFLKNGSLTIPQIIAGLGLKPYKKKNGSRDVYFSELIWREFYYHILYHHPQVENEAFLSHYKDIQWENNKDWFECWKAGKTGFPIVDAGMRELSTTGFMHNRVRMIVASFLTKDLLIDWKWGEQYFMETLLDGDLAPNNGGWQWAASTGCDPQPYFRIFNPWLQSAKFDPQGEYIKKFVPELASVPVKKLHAPIEGHPSYPQPIVEHDEQRIQALALYKRT